MWVIDGVSSSTGRDISWVAVGYDVSISYSFKELSPGFSGWGSALDSNWVVFDETLFRQW